MCSLNDWHSVETFCYKVIVIWYSSAFCFSSATWGYNSNLNVNAASLTIVHKLSFSRSLSFLFILSNSMATVKPVAMSIAVIRNPWVLISTSRNSNFSSPSRAPLDRRNCLWSSDSVPLMSNRFEIRRLICRLRFNVLTGCQVQTNRSHIA